MIVNQIIDEVLTVREVAVLNLGECKVSRLKKGVIEQESEFIIHKNRGRKAKHATTDDIKNLTIELK